MAGYSAVKPKFKIAHHQPKTITFHLLCYATLLDLILEAEAVSLEMVQNSDILLQCFKLEKKEYLWSYVPQQFHNVDKRVKKLSVNLQIRALQ